jgi:3-isopropylmalate dehydratase small subunit
MGCNYYPITTLTNSPPEVEASKLWLSNAVIAESFARIFYRNTFTIGLPALEIPKIKDKMLQGDELKVDIGNFGIENLRIYEYFPAKQVPEFMRKVLFEGGLVEYHKKNKQFPWSNLGMSRKRVNIE